jgi:hypothetical protein
MAYDAHDGYVLLFGGHPIGSPYGVLNDTWKFQGGHWSQLAPTHHPSARAGAMIAYDSADHYVMLFSGGSTLCPCADLRDTWKFSSGSWTNITTKPNPLTPRQLHYVYPEMSYDSADGYVVFYMSTFNPYPAWEATWTFSHGNWTNISSYSTGMPSARAIASFADDPAAGYVLFFGGGTNVGGRSNASYAFSGGNWTPLATTGQITPMGGAALAYDNNSGGMILIPGGVGSTSGTYYSPRTTFDFSGGRWSVLPTFTPFGPPARYDFGMAGGLLFGGCAAGGRAMKDTWSFSDGFWFNLTATVGKAPPARCGAAMVASPGGRVYLFGGVKGSTIYGDLWEFRGGSWLQLVTLGSSPPARYDASAIYDYRTRQIVIFGGENATGFLNDTWLHHWRTGWTTVSSGITPPARASAGLGFTRSSYVDKGNLTLFGGRNATATLGDTWVLHAGSWTKGATNVGPLPVQGAAVAETRPFIVFGGEDPSGFVGSTWRVTIDVWALAHPATFPPARAFGGATWTPTETGGILLFGGIGASGPLGDTWLYPLN